MAEVWMSGFLLAGGVAVIQIWRQIWVFGCEIRLLLLPPLFALLGMGEMVRLAVGVQGLSDGGVAVFLLLVRWSSTAFLLGWSTVLSGASRFCFRFLVRFGLFRVLRSRGVCEEASVSVLSTTASLLGDGTC